MTKTRQSCPIIHISLALVIITNCSLIFVNKKFANSQIRFVNSISQLDNILYHKILTIGTIRLFPNYYYSIR